MKAYFINSAAQSIIEVEWTGLADLNRMVGGSIGTSYPDCLKGGDCLIVDDNGLSKPQSRFFWIDGNDAPVPGNGVVTGPDIEGADIGDEIKTHDPMTPLADLRAHVRFVSRDGVDAWAQTHADEPAVYGVETDGDGREKKAVFATVGEVYGEMPRA